MIVSNRRKCIKPEEAFRAAQETARKFLNEEPEYLPKKSVPMAGT